MLTTDTAGETLAKATIEEDATDSKVEPEKVEANVVES